MYHDELYKQQYNDEKILQDTTIYLKTIGSGTFSYDTLLINKIREQIMNQEQFTIFPQWDNQVVFYIHTGLAYYKSVDIQGFNFSNNSGYYIYVWNNENFYALKSKDIIDYNILSLVNIGDLYNVHMEFKQKSFENFRK